MQRADQCKGGGIGANQQMLPIIDDTHFRIIHTARTPPCDGGRLENGWSQSMLPQTDCSGQSSPTGTDDRDVQDGLPARLICLTTLDPPPTQFFQANQSLRNGVSEMR